MTGFGTVVTGTLVDGSVRVGDEVEVVPGGLRGRIRDGTVFLSSRCTRFTSLPTYVSLLPKRCGKYSP
jgi:translation initiation factor 2 gamma subunit (eIF-2gamma)